MKQWVSTGVTGFAPVAEFEGSVYTLKTVELKYLPGDECYVRGQYRTCYIDNINISKDGKGNLDIIYEWYNLDVGVDCTEVWDGGYFIEDEISVTVFDSMEELEKAFPDDFDFGEECE
jgi:hypothetical protein